VVERLRELADVIDSPLVGVFASHAQALADKDRPALEQVADRFEQLGLLLLAAETGSEIARSYDRYSEPRRAAGWARRVEGLLAVCGPVRTPALRGLNVGAHLTPREREISELAAAGYTTREIADLLVLSSRTVENHLQRAYDKLGIGGRSELAPLFRSAGSPPPPNRSPSRN
jgi:DNA-binding CsgD family transcriptional regulator